MVSTCGEEDLEDVPKHAGDCEPGRRGPKTRVVTNDVVLADAVKCKDGRRMRLAPNVVVSLAVEESMDVQNKSRAEKNVAMYHA